MDSNHRPHDYESCALTAELRSRVRAQARGGAASRSVASEGMAQMRAVVAERPDGPDGLVVREVPRPEPRPGWGLVRVEAFGLNRSEYKTLKGYAGDAVTFP